MAEYQRINRNLEGNFERKKYEAFATPFMSNHVMRIHAKLHSLAKQERTQDFTSGERIKTRANNIKRKRVKYKNLK